MSATAQRNGRARGPRVPLITPAPDPTPEPTAAAAAETPSLDAAVLRIQAKARPLIRNAIGQVQHRQYTYVTLSAVVDEVLPLLVEEQVLVKAFPTTTEDGKPGLRYRVSHIPSGEVDEDTMPLPCDATMQGLGSGLTYGRRYALTAYFNLTVDEDDDGASANQSGSTVPAATPQEGSQTASQPTAKPATKSGRPATVKQRNMLKAKARDAGVTAEGFANILKRAGGDEPVRWQDTPAAERWLERALDRLPARLVDTVVAGIEGGQS